MYWQVLFLQLCLYSVLLAFLIKLLLHWVVLFCWMFLLLFVVVLELCSLPVGTSTG